mmetsp:Transcript_13836/g.27588  ORF Transcript_13836/g.27588 Transcript_13836/m.27588 type:complete len:795 (+) Transcript_13836:304-2688(+)|eukprot:CAMPEP_0194332318 /NCGR_PEP_ID=MMETSP0171-20130528/58731_1 /TAXON_ID=218684 /ORGANISM="Corethron pennatum, Strain L29A3" /LENGTH=794 /DNA_ID=CAMNT_0039094111 /DNA_START=281 /DNA_END=2665 /DNA_ORIENTATION=+
MSTVTREELQAQSFVEQVRATAGREPGAKVVVGLGNSVYLVDASTMESVPIAATGHGQRKKVLLMDYRKFKSQQAGRGSSHDGNSGTGNISVGQFVTNTFGAYDRTMNYGCAEEEFIEEEPIGLPSLPFAVFSFLIQEFLKWSLFCYVLVKALIVDTFRILSHFAFQFYVAFLPEPLRDQVDELSRNAPALTALGTLTLVAFFMHPEGMTWILLGQVREYINRFLKSARLCLTMISEGQVPTKTASGSLVVLICFAVVVLSPSYTPPPTTRMGNTERSRARTGRGRKKKRQKHDNRARHHTGNNENECPMQKRQFWCWPWNRSAKISPLSTATESRSSNDPHNVGEEAPTEPLEPSAGTITRPSITFPSDVPGRKTSYDSCDDASSSTAPNSQDISSNSIKSTAVTINSDKKQSANCRKNTTSSTGSRVTPVAHGNKEFSSIGMNPISEEVKDNVKSQKNVVANQISTHVQPSSSEFKDQQRAHQISAPSSSAPEFQKRRREQPEKVRASYQPNTHDRFGPTSVTKNKNTSCKVSSRFNRKSQAKMAEPSQSLIANKCHPNRENPKYSSKGKVLDNRYTPGKIELAGVLAQVGLVGTACAKLLADVPDVDTLTNMSTQDFKRYNVGSEIRSQISLVLLSRKMKESEMAERVARRQEVYASQNLPSEMVPVTSYSIHSVNFSNASPSGQPVIRPPPGLSNTIGGRDIYEGDSNNYQLFNDRSQIVQSHLGVISPPRRRATTWSSPGGGQIFEHVDAGINAFSQNIQDRVFDDDESRIEADLHELGDQMAISILDF